MCRRQVRVLVTALALAAVVAPAIARAGKGVAAAPRSKRTYTTKQGDRVVVKTTHTRLPEAQRRGQEKLVEVQKGATRYVHKVTKDGPVTDGTFVRTRRTVTIEARPGSRPAWHGQTELRTTRADRSRFTGKRLGPVYKGARDPVRVRFYNPLVRRATLVFGKTRVPMTHDGNRVWEASTGQTIAELDGTAYHIEVDLVTEVEPLLRDPQSNAREIGFIQPDGQVHYFMPDTKKVTLVLHQKDAAGRVVRRRIPMRPINGDSWAARTGLSPEALDGLQHHFEVEGRRVADPAAHAAGGDYGPSRFVDLRYDWGDRSWMAARARDRGFVRRLVRKRGIMEVHPAGLTQDPSAPVSDRVRGTYKALGHPEVIRYLKEQGIGAVELMPIQQQDEFSAEGGGRNYWGYMTTLFNAVSRTYARNPSKAHRELKRAIDRFHRAGIAVIMDVVYNHTANGPRHPFMLDKKAFYEVTPDGSYFMNGSGTGNVLNTRQRMAAEYVVQSLLFWAKEYHVDGFRFDLFALFPAEVVREIEDRLAGEGVFITGEPWDAAGSPKWYKGDERVFTRQASRARSATRRQRDEASTISIWNDDARHTIEALASREASGDSIVTLLGGNMEPYGRMRRPSHGVNITSHDDAYVGDLAGGNQQAIAMANGVQILARGIPSVAMFQDVGATKDGIKNIYNDPGPRNWADWNLARRNAQLGRWTARIRKLRARYPHFHIDQPFRPGQEDVVRPENEGEVNGKAVGVLYRPPPGTRRAQQQDFLVLVNSDHAPGSRARFSLPSGDWKVVANGESLEVDLAGRLGTARGTYEVPSGTMVVLRRPAGGRTQNLAAGER